MFYYPNPNQKITLKQKIVLAVSILLAVALLFLFGITILVIALAGGLITFLVNLFQGKRRPTIHPPTAHSSYPPFRQKRPPKMDDDDIIDI